MTAQTHEKRTNRRKAPVGLRSLQTITAFLGADRTEAARLIKLDGLPAIKVPTPKGFRLKVPVSAFHSWLRQRSTGEPLTLAELQAELDRVDARAA